MINRFETYFDAYYTYFTTEPHKLLKTLGQFENLVFVTMSTRGNKRLIARTPWSAVPLFSLAICINIVICHVLDYCDFMSQLEVYPLGLVAYTYMSVGLSYRQKTQSGVFWCKRNQ